MVAQSVGVVSINDVQSLVVGFRFIMGPNRHFVEAHMIYENGKYSFMNC